MDLDAFRRLPLMGILRGVSAEILPSLVEAVVAAGWQTLEITMNTPRAADLIRRTCALARGRLAVGAGTVLSREDLQTALEAGAGFIVLPALEEEVVRSCRERGIPVFPGALTPQEVYRAWRAGASMVKVFPAKCFGPDYFRELAGPFGGVELLACGGVTPENLADYRRAGARAFAVGAGVFPPERLAAGDFAAVESRLRAYREAWEQTGTANGDVHALIT